VVQWAGLKEGVAIEHPWVTKTIEGAQRKVEARNFDIRKQLLEYDDVANDQRKVIYEQRNRLMEVDDISDSIKAIRSDVMNSIISLYIPPESMAEQWDVKGLEDHLEREYGLQYPIQQWLDSDSKLEESGLRSRLYDEFEKLHEEKSVRVGPEVMRHFEKAVMLQVLDSQWKDHLAAMDHLRQGIHLRGYAQKNPKEEYKRESFQLFSDMLDRIKHEVVTLITRVQIREDSDVEALEPRQAPTEHIRYEHPSASGAPETEPGEVQTVVRGSPKIGRNSPCPCGSGKKYKQCHGKLA